MLLLHGLGWGIMLPLMVTVSVFFWGNTATTEAAAAIAGLVLPSSTAFVNFGTPCRFVIVQREHARTLFFSLHCIWSAVAFAALAPATVATPLGPVHFLWALNLA